MCVSLIKLLITCALFSACILANLSDYKITCKDENGQNVDWFYLYKLPGKFHSKGQKKGCLYYYMTSEMSNPQWKLSKLNLYDSESMAGQTITQAYFDSSQKNGNRLMVAYNDNPPNQNADSKYGHLKGVVVADKRSGFWLIHSVPSYPNISSSYFGKLTTEKLSLQHISWNIRSNPDDYQYPSSGMIYGQSYLCLSLKSKQIDIVGKQLIYDEPQIFDSSLPSNLATTYPNIEDLIHGKRIEKRPFANNVELTTINGASFESFAKSSKFSKELYDDWIAPTLNTSLYVQTWRRSNDISSSCTKTTKVWNVSKIKFSETISFKSTQDHSKWAVSDKGSDWICVGDINRGEKQTERGGGSVCYHSKEVSKSYRSLVTDFESCSN